MTIPLHIFGPEESQREKIDIDTSHENTYNLAVIIPLLSMGAIGKRESLANGGLDGGAGARNQVTQLVARADGEAAEGGGGQLDEVNGDDAPGALDEELLEEGGGDDGARGDEGIGEEEGSAADAAGEDAETTAEDLGGEADAGAAEDGAEVGRHLGGSDHVRREAELGPQHLGIEVLGAVGHEVEAGHEQDEVDEEQPVVTQDGGAVAEEGARLALGPRSPPLPPPPSPAAPAAAQGTRSSRAI